MGSTDDTTDPATAFGTLSDPTRVEIIRELSTAQRENPGDPVLSFAELRKGVRRS